MAHAMDSKEIEILSKKIESARESVLSWFNALNLIVVSKDIDELIKDAYIVKKYNLSKLKSKTDRENMWNNMRIIFKNRFGILL